MWKSCAVAPPQCVHPTPSDLRASSAEIRSIFVIILKYAAVIRRFVAKICWFQVALFVVKLWDPVMSVKCVADSVKLVLLISSKLLRLFVELPQTFAMLLRHALALLAAVPLTRICHQERFAELQMGFAMRRKCARVKPRYVHPMQSLCHPRFAAPAPVNVTLPNDALELRNSAQEMLQLPQNAVSSSCLCRIVIGN